MRYPITLLGLALILFSLNGCNQPDEKVSYGIEDVKLEKYNWKGKPPKKHKVVVENPYGNIYSRTGSYPIVELSGVMQLIGPNAKRPEIIIQQLNDELHIKVHYDKGIQDRYGNRIARFDLGVFVPEGIELDLTTDFGDIKLKKHNNKISAQTNTGSITGSTRNIIKAHSKEGDIKLNLMSWKTTLPFASKKLQQYQLQSDRGHIKLMMDQKLPVAIKAIAYQGVQSNHAALLEQVTDNALVAELATPQRVIHVKALQKFINIQLSGSEQQMSGTSPSSFDGDLRQLPKPKAWQPGDAIIEIEDKIDSSKDSRNKRQSAAN